MRLARYFSTPRRLMALTAWIALCMGLGVNGYRLWRLREIYREKVELWASFRFDDGEGRFAHCWKEEFLDPVHRLKPEVLKYLDEDEEYSARLEQKYKYAAAHPWIVVEPDPPRPELPRFASRP